MEGSGMEGNSCLETILLPASAPCLSQIRTLSSPKEMMVLMEEPKGGSKIPGACQGELRRAHTRRLERRGEKRKGHVGPRWWRSVKG